SGAGRGEARAHSDRQSVRLATSALTTTARFVAWVGSRTASSTELMAHGTRGYHGMDDLRSRADNVATPDLRRSPSFCQQVVMRQRQMVRLVCRTHVPIPDVHGRGTATGAQSPNEGQPPPYTLVRWEAERWEAEKKSLPSMASSSSSAMPRQYRV